MAVTTRTITIAKSTPNMGAAAAPRAAVSQAAPLSSGQNLTFSTSAPSGTRHKGWNPGVGLNATRFAYYGGTYIQPAVTFPYGDVASIKQRPSNTYGFGNARVAFKSDDPIVTFQHQRSSSGVMRVLSDDGNGNFSELFRISQGIRANTAQAGGASTITLDAGASAVNGQYATNYIRITGGTGVGQRRQISGYVGSTKVATVSQAWATQPDATSTFEISGTNTDYTNLTNTGSSNYFVTQTWSERRLRTYIVECAGESFYGIYVSDPSSTVAPAALPTTMVAFWLGDSFGAGTGADLSEIEAQSKVACDQLGWELRNLSVGGTGMLNPGASSFTLPQRVTPPPNAWFVKYSDSTAGSFTLTQNGITVTIGFSDSQATIQTAFNTAFGAGTFSVVGGTAGNQKNIWIMGLGVTALVTSPMVADFSGLTTTNTPAISQYLGDLYDHLPRDSSGNIQPFTIILATGHNDTSSGGYTSLQLRTAYTLFLQTIMALYPMATVICIGTMYLPGGSYGSDATTANADILASVQAAGLNIKGKDSFIEALTSGWFTGTGRIGNLVGNGNSDYCCATDNVHPTTLGHLVYGANQAREIKQLVMR